MNCEKEVPRSGFLSCVALYGFCHDLGSGLGSGFDATKSEWGVWHDSMQGCGIADFCISLPCSSLAAIDRPGRVAPAIKGRTGATPPFLPLVRHVGRGACGRAWGTARPPLSGVAPVQIIPAGRLRTKLRTQTPRGRETRRRQAP